MGAALAVAAIIFVAGLAVGGILLIVLPILTGRPPGRRPPGGGNSEPGPGDPGWPGAAPDDRPRWPGDADNRHSGR